MRAFLPLVLLACSTDPLPDSHSVRLKLINPTAANPFGGVTQLRLSILDADQQVFEETVDVSDAIELPNVGQYGVLRFELAGLNDGGEVLSFGRSAEIAVVPDVEREVAITFLPVNKFHTLGAEFLEPRSYHASVKAPDGRVYLIGGVSADRNSSLNSVEYYEPESGRSIPLANYLSFGTLLPSVAWTDDERLLIHGGATVVDGSVINHMASANQLDAATHVISELPASSLGRRDHCFTSFDGSRVLAIGGTWRPEDQKRAELLVPSPDHPSGWKWQSFQVPELENSRITGCMASEDGRIFFQGIGTGSTGVFTPDPSGGNGFNFQLIDSQQSPAELAFFPYGQMFIPLNNSRIWMGGGRLNLDQDGDLSNDPAPPATRELNLDTMTFSQGADPNLSMRVFGRAEPWIESNTYVAACGGVGSVESSPNTLVEIFSLTSQEVLVAANLDRDRPGCNMNVLDDGAILVTGGHPMGAEVTDGGAILVPYLD